VEERDGFCYHAKDHHGVASPDDSQHARQTRIGGWIGPSKFSPRFKVLSMQNTAPHRTAPHRTTGTGTRVWSNIECGAGFRGLSRAPAGSRVLWLAGPLAIAPRCMSLERLLVQVACCARLCALDSICPRQSHGCGPASKHHDRHASSLHVTFRIDPDSGKAPPFVAAQIPRGGPMA